MQTMQNHCNAYKVDNCTLSNSGVAIFWNKWSLSLISIADDDLCTITILLTGADLGGEFPGSTP